MAHHDDALRTRAERTAYRETSTHEDVLAFIDALTARTDRVRRVSLGQSGEGQDIPALIVSDGHCFTPEEARSQGRLVVMVEANIHAGEVEGKESVLALARDLALNDRHRRLLSRLCLVLVPNFNPDGNDRISTENRRLDLANLEGQVNPEGGVGTRYTGEGWNLNRDSVKQEAIETRNLARFYQAWWPHVFIDCHTTDGSLHSYDLTFDTSHSNQRLFRRVIGTSRKLLEDVAENVESRHGFRSQWYGNFVQEDEPSSGWQTYPALPRFGSHYRGLLGRVDVLLETYSYIGFPRRCAVIYAWLLELFRYCAKHRRRIIRVTEAEEARIINRGESLDPRPQVAIDYGVGSREPYGELRFSFPAYAHRGETITIRSYDRDSLSARRYPGKRAVTYHVPHLRTFIPRMSVSTPLAYLAPEELAPVLERHGIAFEQLDTPTEFDVESYFILGIEKTFSPDVAGLVPPPGAAEIPLSASPPPRRFETVVSARPERRRITFPEGTLLVRTAQRTGTLAVYLLEPCADDGVTRWEFLDRFLRVGLLHPVHRLLSAQPVRPRPE
ncbi:M14 family zinc carboxypeptidase [Chondromyces crocatus]|uniref:Peptidase M14 domain-containing protein n=1 Tax=Chondromyces crocatus TaxID=52 RepID=A0A0K1E9Q5_CHOCO|nr:M14 family zinc carboxypeptidase [Chondromyces crocatus]AKT37595.1 uncharacterized protein CMC5_017360 [Chondromyces crocatus]